MRRWASPGRWPARAHRCFRPRTRRRLACRTSRRIRDGHACQPGADHRWGGTSRAGPAGQGPERVDGRRLRRGPARRHPARPSPRGFAPRAAGRRDPRGRLHRGRRGRSRTSPRAEAVNARGTAHVAEAARDVGARLLHVSTDFVFDGAQRPAVRSRRFAQPARRLRPDQARGRARGEAGRWATGPLIVRTAWVYSRHGENFVRTMLRLMREREEVGVVADQIGTPTWADSLAEALWAAAVRPSGRRSPLDRRGCGQLVRFRRRDPGRGARGGAAAAGGADPAAPHRRYPRPRRARPTASSTRARPGQRSAGTPPHWRVNLQTHARGARAWLTSSSPAAPGSSAPTSSTTGSRAIRATASSCSTR